MIEKGKDEVPLFLFAGEKCLYILDNEVIYFRDFTDVYGNPFKAYNLLLEMYEITNRKAKRVYDKKKKSEKKNKEKSNGKKPIHTKRLKRKKSVKKTTVPR